MIAARQRFAVRAAWSPQIHDLVRRDCYPAANQRSGQRGALQFTTMPCASPLSHCDVRSGQRGAFRSTTVRRLSSCSGHRRGNQGQGSVGPSNPRREAQLVGEPRLLAIKAAWSLQIHDSGSQGWRGELRAWAIKAAWSLQIHDSDPRPASTGRTAQAIKAAWSLQIYEAWRFQYAKSSGQCSRQRGAFESTTPTMARSFSGANLNRGGANA